MLHIIKGDATQPVGEGNKLILHCVNDIGAWGKGFVLSLSRRWPEPEREYRKFWKQFELGMVQLVRVEPNIVVGNLFGQHGIYPQYGVAPIRYHAIAEGFVYAKRFCQDYNSSIHMPRIGCGLAGGRWADIEAIINETLSDVEVTVYDLP